MASASPLVLVVSERAEAQFNTAHEWLRGLPEPFGGEETARRFSATLSLELPILCADIAERLISRSNLPRIDEEASLVFSRPTYRHTFTASGTPRRRRQTAGVWFLFYALPGNGTLEVVFLRHSAAPPFRCCLTFPKKDNKLQIALPARPVLQWNHRPTAAVRLNQGIFYGNRVFIPLPHLFASPSRVVCAVSRAAFGNRPRCVGRHPSRKRAAGR